MRRPRELVLAASASLIALALAPATAAAQDDWSITRHPHIRRGGPAHNNNPPPPHHGQNNNNGGTTTNPARPPRPHIRRGGPAPPPATDHPGTAQNPPPASDGGNTSPPPGTTAAGPGRDRQSRMIALLTESVLRGASDDAGPLAVLMRMVRERDGSIDALVTDFEARARAAPRDAGPHLALGHLYRETGRFEDAVREYQTAESVAPGNPAPARALGALYRRMENNAQARAAYERSLAHTSDRRQQMDTLRQLMDIALASNDVPGARAYHQRLFALDRQSVTVRRELADALLSRHLFTDAVAEYQSLARALAGDNRVLPPVLLDLGRAYAGNNQYEEALGAYRRALSLAGADAGIRRELYEAMTEVYTSRNALPEWIAELERMPGGRDTYDRLTLLGRLQEQAGNTPAAIAAYRRALASRPNDIDAHVRIAQLYHQQGMRAEEIAEYRRLIALAPREPRFVIELADLLINEGQRDEAFRMLAQASARAGSDPNVHERLAEVYARHGRQQEALHEIELVARFDPTSPAGLIALGRQYMELGQRDRALATWRRILDTARDRARGAVALAEVYADNAMLEEAVAMYREAIRLRPDELDFHRGLATVLERARQFDDAIAEWRRVIELSQNDRDVRRYARESIVRLWGLQNRLGAQIAALEQVFARTPPDLEAGRDLAEALIRARRPDDAERVLRRIVELDPGDVVSLVALERVLTNHGDLAGAITVLRRLVEADPRRAREWYQRMAQDALALHRDDEAIEYATHAVQLNDQDATAHLRLAELYRTRGDMGHAIASLRRALELNDRLFPTYFELADLYLGYRNEPREAITLYRQVITLAPDDDYVNRAGRQAIQIAPAAGLGDEVERDLVSTSAANPTRPVFRRLLVAYYDATARPLINRVQQGSAEESARARAALTRLGARAIAPLLDALADSDPAQQRIALDILGYLGNPNATSALVAVAEGNGEAEIKRRALSAAGALGDARALPRLIALQSPQPDTTLATIATWAIAHVHSPAATAALLRSLDRSQPYEVRTMAALGLAGARDARARGTLRAVLAGDSQSSVRAAAAYALGAGIDPSALPTLVAALETGADRQLRAAAAAALGESGNASVAAPALARALFAADPYASVRRTSARALARLSGRETSGARTFDDPALSGSGSRMLDALLDPGATRVDGAAALLRFREEISRAAREAAGGVHESVVAVLTAFGEPGALAPLATAEDVARTEGAPAALSGIVGELLPALGPLMGHPDAAVRRAALRILAESDAPEAVPALSRAVGDAEDAIAAAAIAALARRHASDAGAYEAIAARLEPDAPWDLRAAAADALGGSGDARATDRLANALSRDEYEYVRVAAARALGRRVGRSEDGAGARAALERAAREDPAESVRQAAREALGGAATGA